MDFLEILKWRGMLQDCSYNLSKAFKENEDINGYIGFDLTADSLHIGNLASLMLLKFLQTCGYKVSALVGGATSFVGDPSFKEQERVFLSDDQINYRKIRIKDQIYRLLTRNANSDAIEIYDNSIWFSGFRLMDFLSSVGRYIPVSYMNAKDSVRSRLQNGMSFAEFTYQLFQAYDFYYLYSQYGVNLQMGGSDQWGNLTTGIELVRRKTGNEVFALTAPLISKEDGTKFSKSVEGGNIWLDPGLTSPYEFYQFWFNTSDIEAERYIKIFTLLEKEKIEGIITNHKKTPEKRLLQKNLAVYVTEFVHSKYEAEMAFKTSEVLFSNNVNLLEIREQDFLEVFHNVNKIHVNRHAYKDISELLTLETKNMIFASKAELNRVLDSGGLFINKKKILNLNFDVSSLLLYDKYIVVQKGKKNYYLIVVD